MFRASSLKCKSLCELLQGKLGVPSSPQKALTSDAELFRRQRTLAQARNADLPSFHEGICRCSITEAAQWSRAAWFDVYDTFKETFQIVLEAQPVLDGSGLYCLASGRKIPVTISASILKQAGSLKGTLPFDLALGNALRQCPFWVASKSGVARLPPELQRNTSLPLRATFAGCIANSNFLPVSGLDHLYINLTAIRSDAVKNFLSFFPLRKAKGGDGATFSKFKVDDPLYLFKEKEFVQCFGRARSRLLNSRAPQVPHASQALHTVDATGASVPHHRMWIPLTDVVSMGLPISATLLIHPEDSSAIQQIVSSPATVSTNAKAAEIDAIVEGALQQTADSGACIQACWLVPLPPPEANEHYLSLAHFICHS